MKSVKMMSFMIVFFIMACSASDNTLKPFTQQTLDGKTIQSADLKGMPLVINFSGPEWPQCQREAPDLQRAYLDYNGKGVFFLSVFTLGENQDIKKFAETYNITYPVGRDNELAKQFRVMGLPVTVFIAKDGKISRKHVGLIAADELKTNIEAILR